ncbi:MAG: DNA polymerase III [Treponema sp.]|nr:DNA polymerase III [Treponema sp.]
MFDNLLYQPAAELLQADILENRLPGAILLSGPAASGKLTCALEIARVLSCTGPKKGHWLCTCPACKKNKELSFANVLLAGGRDCILEIRAAKHAFLQAALDNASHLTATRYLFIRAVRKLTMRFSQILWEGDEKLPKFAPCLQAIDEQMELLDMEKPLPENQKLEKICAEIEKQAEKLESGFMYDSLPISLIRHASLWAHMKSASGKKVFIIENAESMNEAARNALLKTLEEPPADTVFVLTTARRGAVMPTILSRVRTYTFTERTKPEQEEVIRRVFHGDASLCDSDISTYLQTFLPITPHQVAEQAQAFMDSLSLNAAAGMAQISQIVKACSGFDPRILLKLFLTSLLSSFVPETAARAETAADAVSALRNCYNNVQLYNQTPQAALEKLWRDLYIVQRSALRG